MSASFAMSTQERHDETGRYQAIRKIPYVAPAWHALALSILFWANGG
jgi:hypothetical protein